MSDTTNRAQLRRFVANVEQRCGTDPGARIALRKGLGKGLDDVLPMHRVIAHWVPAGDDDLQRAYYAVAAMIAQQPRSSFAREDDEAVDSAAHVTSDSRRGMSLGKAFALAVSAAGGQERTMRAVTAEAHLTLLTKQNLAGLHRHLPSKIRYLCDLGAPLDWAQLIADLSIWRRSSGSVTRRWLQDFYRELARATHAQAEQNDAEEAEADPISA